MRIIDHFVVGGPCSGKRQYKPTLLDSVSAFNKDTKVKKLHSTETASVLGAVVLNLLSEDVEFLTLITSCCFSLTNPEDTRRRNTPIRR